MKSNCLIEALKAKIKNPKSVTIHVFPLSLNNNQLHFYWIDDSENRVFHYAKANCNSFCCPLFEGVLKKRIRDCFEEKMMMAMIDKKWSYKKIMKVAKKMGIRNSDTLFKELF